MIKKHLISFLIGGLTLLLAGLLYVIPADANAPHGLDQIKGVFIGDSNTAVETAVSESFTDQGDVGYVNRLNIWMGYRYRFISQGCYGATTRDWYLPSSVHQPYAFCYTDSGNAPRLFDVRALPDMPADFAVIMLGSNDSVGASEPPNNEPTPVSEYEVNMRGLVADTIAAGTPKVILMTPPTRIDCVIQAIQGNPACVDRLTGYKDAVMEICGESSGDGVICGPDVQALTIADPWVWFVASSTDVTHFSTTGHILLAEALQETLEENGLAEPITMCPL